MRVLVLVQGSLGERLAGPEIRGWEMAREFARRHEVTVAAGVAREETRDGIRVVPHSRRRVLAEISRHDVVAGPVLPPYALLALAPRPCVRIADLYDPVELELATAQGLGARRAAASRRAMRRLQLRWSDVVLSANEAQAERTRADLMLLPRRGPAPSLLTVPMGLPAPPAQSRMHPLRDSMPGIGPDDVVVLWWGTVWRWLDAPTAIEAVGRLSSSRPNIRLVITAGKPANTATDGLNATEAAREHARRLGLLGRTVFFLDEWVPFEQRHAYLQDADAGITLHAATAEAPLAARARYMDYLWAGLPSVLAEGDEVATRLGQAGAARLVPPQDAAATARALDDFLSDPAALTRARRACFELSNEYRWAAVMAPLVDHVEALERRHSSGFGALGIACATGRYYARRAVDRLTPAWT